MMIRPASTGDVPSIVILWREMWDLHLSLDPRYRTTPFADEVMKEWIERSLGSDRARVIVAEDPGIVGYIHGMLLENPPVVPWVHFGYVSEIAVTASARRKGAGAKLVEAIHRWFLERGMPYVEVNVSVRNVMSRSFWRKVGYAEFLERLRFDLS